MAAALVLSGRLTRPVKALTATIRRMGRGDLSARVSVRTSGELRELADSYNVMAEQLEHLDASRSQFVSDASHELKTPLATMKVLLESMIYQPDMPDELRAEFMQDINHEIDRLNTIITDLLTLTREDSQGKPLHTERFDLSALADETVHALRTNAEQKSQVLTADIAPDIDLLGDRSKLAQVFYNLTDNAVKYTPEGGHIAVTLRKDGTQAIFTVQDDGIGIPSEDQKHIFERFYRVDKARSRETGGTGLGLSIVRQMVTLHGGTVEVSSSVGHGSTFTVHLPLSGKGGEQA
jgi:two-component system, OmpR family, sensor kinase